MRPWTFFEDGIVGHISMADPFDKSLSETIYKAISKPGVLAGEDIKVHSGSTVICIGNEPPRQLISVLTPQQRDPNFRLVPNLSFTDPLPLLHPSA